MKRIHIIGQKNSGKTTLVVELVEALTQQGHRVGTIKHTHHQHELDTPGKDSHRHRQAGAAAVGILSRNMNALFWPPEADQSGDNRYARFEPLLAQCDFLLVEGDMHTNGCKIEVWRQATGRPPLATTDGSILAVVTDDEVLLSVPVWPRSPVDQLVEKILNIQTTGEQQSP